MDIARMMDRISHKAEILNEVLNYPSDRAASRALEIPRSTLYKWRRQADIRSRRNLINSLAGIPGPKGIRRSQTGQFDEHEGMVLVLLQYFPEWSDSRIITTLGALGYQEVSFEEIRIIRRLDGMRSTPEETGDPEDIRGEAEISDQEDDIEPGRLLEMLFNTMLARFLEDRPLRAAFMFTEMINQMAASGRSLARAAHLLGLENERLDLDSIENECRTLQEDSLALRNILLGTVPQNEGEASQSPTEEERSGD